MSVVVGWTDCYSNNCPVVTFTEDRKNVICAPGRLSGKVAPGQLDTVIKSSQIPPQPHLAQKLTSPSQVGKEVKY